MNSKPELDAEQATGLGNLLVLASLSLVGGAGVGLLAAVFRVALERIDRFRDSALVWAHGEKLVGFLAVIGISAVATGLAAWLVRQFSPQATGSGIPHVEAQTNGQWSGSPLRILPVKFFGGVLAMGTGLALGREGPRCANGSKPGSSSGQSQPLQRV
jgi:CIC family chloride channel protein